MPIKQHADKVRESLLADMERSKNIIFDGLLNNSSANKIPESLFVNYFLPCFLNKVHNPNWVLEWISIAGSPMAEVGVFKDNTNSILYYVPSILNSNNLILTNGDGNLTDIFNRYSQIKNNIPGQGLKFLLEALDSKNNELFNNMDLSEVNKRWVNILSLYNLIPLTNENSSTASLTNSDYFDI